MELMVGMFALGFVLGFIFARKVSRSQTAGSLMINTDDPDGPYLFLKLKSSPYEVMQKKQVTLEIDVQKRNSQK